MAVQGRTHRFRPICPWIAAPKPARVELRSSLGTKGFAGQ